VVAVVSWSWIARQGVELPGGAYVAVEALPTREVRATLVGSKISAIACSEPEALRKLADAMSDRARIVRAAARARGGR
jgi:hypothetical protein